MASNEVPTGRRMNGAQMFMRGTETREEIRNPKPEIRRPKPEVRKSNG